MFFAILAIVLTVLFMCIPVAALVVVHRSSVKLMKPLGAGITAILASSVISAAVLLLYEDGGVAFCRRDGQPRYAGYCLARWKRWRCMLYTRRFTGAR